MKKNNDIKTRWMTILLILFLFYAGGCSKSEPKILLAKIDDKNIYADELVQEISDSAADFNTIEFTKPVAIQILNQIIDGYIILSEARKAGFTEDLRIKKSLAKIRNVVYYREAVDHFVTLYDHARPTARQAIEFGESQNLLREYGFILNDAVIKEAYTQLKQHKDLDDAYVNTTVVAEFNGGKIFLIDVADNNEKIGTLPEFQEYIFSVARKKVFAVYAIKNNLHRKQNVIEKISQEQRDYVAEKFELVQLNQFLRSQNKKRINISNETLGDLLGTMAKYESDAWKIYRKNWVENLRQEHKIMMSEKGMQAVLRMMKQRRA